MGFRNSRRQKTVGDIPDDDPPILASRGEHFSIAAPTNPGLREVIESFSEDFRPVFAACEGIRARRLAL